MAEQRRGGASKRSSSSQSAKRGQKARSSGASANAGKGGSSGGSGGASASARKGGSSGGSSGASANARKGGSSGGSRSAASSSNGLSAADVVAHARGELSELLGRPVEGVLGIERDHGNWLATVQVVELSRIPNTTDVLGEYEAVLDRNGELVSYHRTRRYQRGQVDVGER
jgi:hypothetical protein